MRLGIGSYNRIVTRILKPRSHLVSNSMHRSCMLLKFSSLREGNFASATAIKLVGIFEMANSCQPSLHRTTEVSLNLAFFLGQAFVDDYFGNVVQTQKQRVICAVES